jgi:AcrR family transcriptional regulator
MHEEQEIKSRILTRANEMFAAYGCSRVTMEEIAVSLGISKKTLYKYYDNKGHILKEIIFNTKCEIGNVIDSILDDETISFTEKLKKLLTYIGTQAGKFHGPMMQDLQQNHPDVYNEIKEFRKKNSHEKILKLFAEGMEKGIIRKDINMHIATVMYVSAIHNIIVPEALDELNIPADAVFMEIIKILFEGIFTDEGRNLHQPIYEITTLQENV